MTDIESKTANGPKPTIPLGSLVLVTAANGLIASHVCNQLLAAGFRVRGTVRDAVKHSWMTATFKERYPDRFELANVPDIAAPGAWSECVKGASGIVHVASLMTLNGPDLEEALRNDMAVHVPLLEAAMESSVKSIAMVSSAWAAWSPDAAKAVTLTTDSWNEEAIRLARDKSVAPETKVLASLMALKALVEKEIWTWIEQNKPEFNFNTLLLDSVMGGAIDPINQGLTSTAAMVCWPWEGVGIGLLNSMQPQWYIGASDTGRLAVAALTLPDVDRERLFGFGARYSWYRVAQILKEMYPERKVVDGIRDLGWDQTEVPWRRTETLLKRVGGKGFTSLENCVRAAAESWIEAHQS